MREKKTWQEELNDKRLAEGGWYGCAAPDGWKDIVLRADKMLSHIDPDYKIHQIKEKWGTLRYYFGHNFEYESVEAGIMRAIETWAEQRSANTCEQCGKFGELRTDSYYIVTLCDTCHESREAEIAKRVAEYEQNKKA
jgi:hypothetical protein